MSCHLLTCLLEEMLRLVEIALTPTQRAGVSHCNSLAGFFVKASEVRAPACAQEGHELTLCHCSLSATLVCSDPFEHAKPCSSLKARLAAAEVAILDASVTRCETLCAQALIQKGAKMVDRLRQFTTQCAATLKGPWEGKLNAELADLVTTALATAATSSAAPGVSALAPMDGSHSDKPKQKEKEKKEKKAKEKDKDGKAVKEKKKEKK